MIDDSDTGDINATAAVFMISVATIWVAAALIAAIVG